MERQTFNVVFFCKKTKISKKGKAPIYVRVTTTGRSTEIYTQCQIEPERWNQKAERILSRDKLAEQINEIITSYRTNIFAVYNQLIKEGREPDCFIIKERLANPVSNSKLFLAELSKYCDKRQKEVGIRLTQLTANKYHRLLRYLKEYMQAQYKKEDLPLDRVNYEYLDGLNTFIQTVHNCKTNGAVNLLCCLKNFMLYAIRNEWIEKNPFQYYKLKPEHNKSKDHLTKAELDTLIRKQMPNERIERIRDVFAFCCLTGLAFTDADHLRPEHISADDNGQLWIHKPREKTAVMSRIPLLPHPVKLLQKYEHDPNCRQRGNMQYRQDADDARRPAHVRLPCRGVRNADRCACKNPRPHQYEYDAALRQVLRGLDRSGDAEDRQYPHQPYMINKRPKIEYNIFYLEVGNPRNGDSKLTI